MPQANDKPGTRRTAPAAPELTADQRDMLRQLNETLEDAGIYVAAEIRGGILHLAGEVDSVENRQAALDVATALTMPTGLPVEDDIEITTSAPEDAFGINDDQQESEYGYIDPDANNDGQLDAKFAKDPDFTGDVGTRNAQVATMNAVPYFPETDPLVEKTSDRTESELVLELREPNEEGEYLPPHDDDIRQAIVDALATDSETQELHEIQVAVVNGVVALRGYVPRLEDAENAEAVASRIPAAREVREQLTVRSLRDR